MKDRLTGVFEKYGTVFVIFCIVIAGLGLIISYVFPNKVIDTIEVNMEENEDFNIVLKPGRQVEYYCNTGLKPMVGIQVGISKEGAEFPDGRIIYEVYNGDGTVLYGTGEQMLEGLFDLQYVYLPFAGMGECNGDLRIVFSYTGSNETGPVLIANKSEVEAAGTLVDGEAIEGNLKSCYIYTHNTYPLVFDLKIMLAVFVTVFFTLGKTKQKVDLIHEQ